MPAKRKSFPRNYPVRHTKDIKNTQENHRYLLKELLKDGHELFSEFEYQLQLAGGNGRRHRADIFVRDLWLLIEIDGLRGQGWGATSWSRHSSALYIEQQYERDLAAASELGLRVLRCSTGKENQQHCLAAVRSLARHRPG